MSPMPEAEAELQPRQPHWALFFVLLLASARSVIPGNKFLQYQNLGSNAVNQHFAFATTLLDALTGLLILWYLPLYCIYVDWFSRPSRTERKAFWASPDFLTLRRHTSGPRLCGGSDQFTRPKDVNPLDSRQLNPWKLSINGIKEPVTKPRRIQHLAPGPPVIWDSPKREVDPQQSSGSNPWKMATGLLPQTIKPACRRTKHTEVLCSSGNKTIDSWAPSSLRLKGTGVDTRINSNIIRNPSCDIWEQFFDRTWFTPCLADDWVRLAFHRPVSCGFSENELPDTSSTGSTLMELARTIPTYEELEPLLKPGLEAQELERSLQLTLATPCIQGLDGSQFWTFIAKYLCSFQAPSFDTGTRSYAEDCPGLLKTHFARSSGLGIATTECALQDTPIAGLWGATYEVAAEDIIILTEIGSAIINSRLRASHAMVTSDYVLLGPQNLMNHACEDHATVSYAGLHEQGHLAPALF